MTKDDYVKLLLALNEASDRMDRLKIEIRLMVGKLNSAGVEG